MESLQPKHNDLRIYREKNPEITLFGMIDDSDMKKFKSPQYLRNSIKESIKTLGKKGGYILGPTNFLLAQPIDNTVALF